MVKRNVRTLLLVTAFLLLSLFVLSSCGEAEGEKPYDHLVTFDYNAAGIATESPASQYLGVKDGGLVGLKPGANDDFKEAVIKQYFLEGWYTAKTAADGSVERDRDGRVLLDKKWNFETDRVTGDMTLYANFVRQSTLTIRDIVTDEVLSDLKGAPGDKEPNVFPPEKKGHTLVGYYKDKEKTDAFDFGSFVYGEEDVTIYADFIEGNYMLVSDFAGLQSCLRSDKKAYLTGDIDAAGKTWGSFSFRGTILGNGHKITGLKIKTVCSGKTGGETYGLLFASLGAGAKLSDVTFEDVEMTVSAAMNGTYTVTPIAYSVAEGATLENVTVTGRLTYDFSAAPTSTVTEDFGGTVPEGALKNCRFVITLVDRNG